MNIFLFTVHISGVPVCKCQTSGFLLAIAEIQCSSCTIYWWSLKSPKMDNQPFDEVLFHWKQVIPHNVAFLQFWYIFVMYLHCLNYCEASLKYIILLLKEDKSGWEVYVWRSNSALG
jgi:hypothetical protein